MHSREHTDPKVVVSAISAGEVPSSKKYLVEGMLLQQGDPRHDGFVDDEEWVTVGGGDVIECERWTDVHTDLETDVAG